MLIFSWSRSECFITRVVRGQAATTRSYWSTARDGTVRCRNARTRHRRRWVTIQVCDIAKKLFSNKSTTLERWRVRYRDNRVYAKT